MSTKVGDIFHSRKDMHEISLAPQWNSSMCISTQEKHTPSLKIVPHNISMRQKKCMVLYERYPFH